MLGLTRRLLSLALHRSVSRPVATLARRRFVPKLNALDERVVPDATVFDEVQPFLGSITWYDENGQPLITDFPGGVTLHTKVTWRADNTYLWSYRLENQSLAPPDYHIVGSGVVLWGFASPNRLLVPDTASDSRNQMGLLPNDPEGLWYWDCTYSGGIIPGEFAEFTRVTPIVPLVPCSAYINAGTWWDWYDCPTVGPGSVPAVSIAALDGAVEDDPDRPGSNPINGAFRVSRTGGDMSKPLTVGVRDTFWGRRSVASTTTP